MPSEQLVYIYLSKESIHQWVLLEHYTCQRMLMIQVMPVHQIQSWDTYAKWPSYGPLPHRQEVQEVKALVRVLVAGLHPILTHTLRIVASTLLMIALC